MSLDYTAVVRDLVAANLDDTSEHIGELTIEAIADRAPETSAYAAITGLAAALATALGAKASPAAELPAEISEPGTRVSDLTARAREGQLLGEQVFEVVVSVHVRDAVPPAPPKTA